MISCKQNFVISHSAVPVSKDIVERLAQTECPVGQFYHIAD